MDRSAGRQFGVLLLVGVLVAVSCGGAVYASAHACQDVVVAERGTGDGSDGGASEKEEGKADLGVPPVLLWDRMVKPFRLVGHEISVFPLADTVGARVRANFVSFQASVQVEAVAVLLRQVLAGNTHQPHGPPAWACGAGGGVAFVVASRR